jgi:DegV family protein with EDD domain
VHRYQCRYQPAQVHVDEPELVFDVARRFGEISAEKADDMRRQQASSHDANRRFAVITDSAADIPDEDMERLDIHMVPCRIQFGDRGYLDKVSITADEFFEELRSNPNHPTTSQPAPGDFRRQYQFLASHFADVLSINLTGKASGTLEAAKSAAERVNAHGKVHVINSRNASLGQGLLVVAAAEYAKAGLGVQDAIAAVERLIPETRTYGLLKDLRFAVRGGRVPRWVKTIADLLRATAIIRTVPDGRVASGTFLFGRRNRIQRFARYVARKTPAADALDVAIGHAVCPDDAAELERALRKRFDNVHRTTITDIGAALGAHGGPGTLIVSTQPYARPARG